MESMGIMFIAIVLGHGCVNKIWTEKKQTKNKPPSSQSIDKDGVCGREVRCRIDPPLDLILQRQYICAGCRCRCRWRSITSVCKCKIEARDQVRARQEGRAFTHAKCTRRKAQICCGLKVWTFVIKVIGTRMIRIVKNCLKSESTKRTSFC